MSKKFGKEAHSFKIKVGESKAMDLRHEKKESPAKEKMEEKLYKAHMKKKAKKVKKGKK